MTRLRKMMLEELERRNYSEATTRCYIRTVEDFSNDSSVLQMVWVPNTFVNIRPSCSRSASCHGTVTQRLQLCDSSTSRLSRKTWSIAETPYPKKAFHLPSILSREEVARLIDAALTPYHRAVDGL